MKGVERLDGNFLTGLLSIIVIDLVLAGDNAIIIGMAARNLPKDKQKKAIFWGTGGAIIIRALLTMIVVWLLEIPFLMLAGGLFLIWIAFKLLIQKKDHGNVKEGQTLFEAVRTIIIADVVMGLDNVLAIAGAAQGRYLLVIIGLIISVPIIIWGSTLILKFIERFPIIIYIGAGVLAYTAGSMITGDKTLYPYIGDQWMIKYGIIAALIIAVLYIGWRVNTNRQRQTA